MYVCVQLEFDSSLYSQRENNQVSPSNLYRAIKDDAAIPGRLKNVRKYQLDAWWMDMDAEEMEGNVLSPF